LINQRHSLALRNHERQRSNSPLQFFRLKPITRKLGRVGDLYSRFARLTT